MEQAPVKVVRGVLDEAARLGKGLVELSAQSLGHRLGHAGVDVLVEYVASGRLRATTTLDLWEAGLGDEGFAQLISVASHLPNLADLHLQRNQLGDGAMKALALAAERGALNALEVLRLQANEVGERGMSLLTDAGKGLPSLKVLNLKFGNPFGEGGAHAFARAADVGHFRGLEALAFRGNGIGPKGVHEIWSSLRGMPSLMTLEISKNQVGDDGMAPIDSAPVRRLEGLDVADNRIGDTGARALARLLRSSGTMKWLGLSGNEIGDGGAAALASAFGAGTRLRVLDLKLNPIGDQGADAIAGAAESGGLRDLERLSIWSKRMTRVGVERLKLAVTKKSCPRLKSLELSPGVTDQRVALIWHVGDGGGEVARAMKEPNAATRWVRDRLSRASGEGKRSSAGPKWVAVVGTVRALEASDARMPGALKDALDNAISKARAEPGLEVVVAQSETARMALRGFEECASAEEWINAHEDGEESSGASSTERMVERSEERAERLERALRSLRGRPTSDYGEIRDALSDLTNATRDVVADRLQVALNEKLRTVPQATYEDKRELAKWVNAELRRFGVALRCPKTGRPAFLVGHPGGQEGVGRFHLEVTNESGRPVRTVTSVTLPHLELMPDVPARATEKAGRKR